MAEHAREYEYRSASWRGTSASKRILVVDDYLHSLQGLRNSLVGSGYEVETAEDSWRAIKKMKERRFDLAIVDLDLPPVHGVAMTGWDLVRIFRAFNPLVSIIVVSAESAGDGRDLAAELKVSAFLEKPISPAKLKAVVKALDG